MRALLLAASLATAAAAQPSAADRASVDRFLDAVDFDLVVDQMDRARGSLDAFPGGELVDVVADADYDAVRDSIRAELARDLRPALLDEASAFYSGPVYARLVEAGGRVEPMEPIGPEGLLAFLDDPGDLPLADSALSARYAAAVTAASQPPDTQRATMEAALSLFPASMREQLEALGGIDAVVAMAKEATGDLAERAMARSAQIALAHVDEADVIAATAFYESPAGVYSGHAVARGSLAVMLPAMVEAMRPMVEAMSETAGRAGARRADPAFARAVEAVQAAADYPGDARAEGVGGVVMVRVTLDPDGAVLDAEALDAPDPRLAAAALRAVDAVTFPAPTYLFDDGTSPLVFPVSFDADTP